ncbi:sensor histidine kinase [Curtobacterium sp. MCBA15_012]|uniref:sensor histidine kinase n=1 Tax=Curtobacterium sp. MCBA15_012 TaxID=1898738 RepID=UPI0009F46FCC|nr:sensor histidine kinase [Curtobacterium sp. MCBA15_012]WIB00476.1 sensor domain-containing protein [Curtobacterium sp. MCBA15_012]
MSRSATVPPFAVAPRFHFTTALFRATTWRQFAFHAAHLPIAVAALAWFAVTIAVGVPAAVTWFGLVVSAFLLGGGAWFAAVTRRMSAALLEQEVAPPRFRARRPGLLGWATTRLTDPARWRAFAYLLVGFVVTTCSFAVSTAVLVTSLGAVTHAAWGRYLPAQVGADGREHRGAQLLGTFVDTVPMQLAFAALGVVLLLAVWPAVNHGLGSLQRVVIRSLLGTTRRAERLAQVTASRDAAVVDADATLRRIERELHDGTQARLVGLAMTLGDARDRLQHGQGGAGVEALVDQAHAATKEALVELRALARGIHPPVLDAGLEAALTSACARVPFPVTLRTDLPVRPAPVVEGIAYFGVLELLTNVSKHAGATSAVVDVALVGTDLVATVQDDGVGGAHVALTAEDGHGTGLAGLLERLRAVDGSLHVDSPAGGPTSVRLVVPAGAAT